MACNSSASPKKRRVGGRNGHIFQCNLLRTLVSCPFLTQARLDILNLIIKKRTRLNAIVPIAKLPLPLVKYSWIGNREG
jgi:hypothetical protein